MDPITLASRRFQEEFLRFWNPPPGHELAGPRVVRLAVAGTSTMNVRKSLRLLERRPGGQRPYLIVDAPVSSRSEYIAAIASAFEVNYAALVQGFAEQGIAIPAVPRTPRPVTISGVVETLRRIVAGTFEALDGLALVLLPARIDDPTSYAEILAALASASDGSQWPSGPPPQGSSQLPSGSSPHGSQLWLAALDHDVISSNYPGSASFTVDEAALVQHLKTLGQDSRGPAAKPPGSSLAGSSRAARAAPSGNAALEGGLGQQSLAKTTGIDLRAYLLDAAAAMGEGKHKLAVRHFRAARMLCRVNGFADGETLTSIALGSAAYGAGDKRGALAAFGHAKNMALARGNNVLAAQAELGIAAVHLASADYALARKGYAEIMELAAAIPALRLEAMRMEAECYLLENREQNAASAFLRAIDEAAELPPDVRQTTSFAQSGKALANLYERHRQPSLAAAVSQRIAALSLPSGDPEMAR
jgi:tetratricopeptide (TPR) repeat protein